MLTGFMGVGKTTVGELLAARLGLPFLDADQEIEKLHGMPVTEIFRTMGEKAFRQMEKDFIVDLCRNQDPKIVSLGGGAFMQEEIRNACLTTSLVLHLDLSWNAWKQRLLHILESRPVLHGKSLEEIEDLYLMRRQVYVLSHRSILVDDMTPEETAELICGILQAPKTLP